MSSSSFQRLATVTASTKRAQTTDRKRGAPITSIVELFCWPIDPAETEKARDMAVRLRQELNSPFELLQTFVAGDLDIVEGDILVVAGKEYPIRSVSDWAWRGSTYLALLLEETKQ